MTSSNMEKSTDQATGSLSPCGQDSAFFDVVNLDSMLCDAREFERDSSKAELTSFLKFKDRNALAELSEMDRIDEEGSTSSSQSTGMEQNAQGSCPKKKGKRKCSSEEGSSDLGWLMNYSAAKLFKPSIQDLTNQANIRTKEARVDPKYNKPGITYTEMIEKALIENGQLTVSEIYKWIQTKFPYFDKDDPRWKNSVRHNLSINPQFRKGPKSDKGGSGHYWKLNKEHDEKYSQWVDKGVPKAGSSKKKPEVLGEDKLPEEIEESLSLDDEVERATKSILRYSDPLPFGDTNGSTDVYQDLYMGPNVEVELIQNSPPTWDENSSDNFDPILADSILFSDTANLTLQSFDLRRKIVELKEEVNKPWDKSMWRKSLTMAT